MKRLHLLLALLTILTVPVVAWGIGKLEPMMGTPFGQFSTSAVVTSDTSVSAVPSFLQCIIIVANDTAPTAGTISIEDGTSAGSGTVVFTWPVVATWFSPVQICPQRLMTTGIYINFTTTADVGVFVSYR